jgi:hypothetical protein
LAASAARGEYPRRGKRMNALRMQLAKAEITGAMKRLLPRPSGRSQTLSRRTRRLLKKGEPRGRTGNQRVRVLVVEKFEWQSSEGRIGTVLVWRGVARRRVGNNNRCLARRKPNPRRKLLTTGGGGEKANSVRRSHALS